MSTHFITLLQAAVLSPDNSLSELSMISPAEKLQLKQWGCVQKPIENLCLHQLFEQQVPKTPSLIALRVENMTYTYEELNIMANQIARTLYEDFGVHKSSIVGVLLSRNQFIVPTILAIFKLGCIYLPLDPSYPANRLQLCIQFVYSNHAYL